ncbi:uncharacterized protein EDB91DRAFT_1134199 [Suillus paluster]|uniref:uncharacterized protein n=1 Tax=Suillus paluster TaxID=48578 RepID=UPI001B86A1E8|nr:uncharacterized protein EDB91DRAFT_1134199 [Suillus paluster]KAG1739862.1 hypothetical protein EDB91DRAFT_1134199 [Suillus paluster]
MAGACEQLDMILARDAAAKNFSWFILPGRSMASVRFESKFAPQAWMPPNPTYTSTEEQTPKYIWHPHGVAMIRPTLNQHLQAYFYKVQHILPRICHPSVIHNEARLITHSVNAGFNSKPESFGEAVAKALFRAGATRLEYTRTVALLTNDVLIELNLSDWCAMRALRLYLEDIATSTVLKAWSNISVDFMFTSGATGLEKASDSLEPIRNEMFNAAAFYGDLVAIGIIPRSLFDSVINGFLDCLTSVSQCRMLYLMLVRATFHIASPIQPSCLLAWHKKLLSPKRIRLPMDDVMVQRWIIELCNVIDKAVVQNQAIVQRCKTTNSPAGNHIWDTKLTRQGLHDLIEKM